MSRVPPVTRDGCTSPGQQRRALISPQKEDVAMQKYVNDYHNQNEIQQTRRMLEIFHGDSLGKAVEKEVLSNERQFRDKISRYVVRN